MTSSAETPRHDPHAKEALAQREALAARLRASMPEQMRELSQWLLWRLEEVKGREGLQKVPYYANGRKRFGQLGGDEDRAKLVTLESALKRFTASQQFSGVGFAFIEGDGLIGVDLDWKHSESAEMPAHHSEIIEACDSYTERSPSGKGVHIIVGGQLDSFKHDPVGVEVYCGGRYFTCTGDHYAGTPKEVRPLKAHALSHLRHVVESSKDALRAQRQVEQHRAAAPAATGQVSRHTPTAQRGNDFRRVNEAAYASLSSWVPLVLPKARAWRDGYRVTSKDLGRALEEDLQLTPEGIMDFGEEHGMSPVDVVMKWMPGMAQAKDALHWLAPIVGVQLSKPRVLRLVETARDERPDPPPAPPPEGQTEEGGEKRPRKQRQARGNAVAEGGGGTLTRLLKHFALIYGTDTVWDGEARMVMAVNNLRLLHGKPFVNGWLDHPDRRLLRPEQIKFEPGVELDDGSVNLFDGLPTVPVDCEEAEVAPMLDLLRHLCSRSAPTPEGCAAVFDQVVKWCALMVQQPGAKIRFALVFHGPQGAGKNLFFDTFRRIFGKYGKMVGQAELEDRFNGYMSGKLLLVANEVMTRQELFHGKNKLKWVITEDEIPIRGMHQEVRWETNHANVVFLSNEAQPLALDLDDRRHLVVYTPPAEHRDLYLRVADFVRDDGVAKFMGYLQRVDLDGFDEHTKPLMTQAKQDLIQLGMRAQERFAAEWLEGYLDLPVQVCSAEQLYRVYRRWADLTGVRYAGEQTMFTAIVKKFVMERREVDASGEPLAERLAYRVIGLKDHTGHCKAVRCWVPRGCEPLNGVSLGEWAGEAVERFELHVGRYGRRRSDDDQR